MSTRKHRQMKILIVEQNFHRLRDISGFFANIPNSKDNELTQTSSLAFTKTNFVSRYEVFETDTPKSALETFQSAHPDLILIGNCGNNHESRQLCGQIRLEEKERRTGIIFLASQNENDDFGPVECLEMGADDYIFSTATSREIIARVEAVMRLKSITDELRAANHRLEILSMTDDLTGLSNMRAFNQDYNSLLDLCHNGSISLAVLMMDLDHFKNINDTKNHLIGSYIIGEIGKLVRLGGIFPRDAAKARYGGDEYIIAYPSNTISEAGGTAERLRLLVETSRFNRDGYDIRVTSSIGVAWIKAGFECNRDDPIKIADMMLYKSKADGRNMVSSTSLENITSQEDLDLSLAAFDIHVSDILGSNTLETVPVEKKLYKKK